MERKLPVPVPFVLALFRYLFSYFTLSMDLRCHTGLYTFGMTLLFFISDLYGGRL